MLKNAYITCRTPSTTPEGWHHIYPRGEFPIQARIDGKAQEIDLVLDDDAFGKIIASFREDQQRENFAGVLVAQEHFADMEDKSSEAAAWIDDLEIRPDGLWARYGEVTDLGQSLIGKRYKFRSPVSDIEQIAGRRWRPIDLDSVGLTNKPKFKQLAVSLARDGQNQQEEETMDKLVTLLGLAEGAGEDAILDRVKQALEAETELAAAVKKLADLDAEELIAEAEAFVEEHKDLIEDPEAVKEQYIEARDTTKKLFGVLKAGKGTKAPAARVLSRDTARVPDRDGLTTAPQAQETARAARISARAGELQRTGLNLRAAYDKAAAEIPATA